MRRGTTPLLAVLMLLCGVWSALPAAAETLQCFASILPQRHFIQRIGGSLVTVSVMVPHGIDPHGYEPKPSQMKALSHSALYFAQGIEFERVWLPKIAAANPKLQIIHTDAGIEKRILQDPHHGPGGAHGHGAGPRGHGVAPDPHIWLSPPLVKQQAKRILDALVKAAPQHENRFRTRFAAFAAEVDDLDRAFRALFAGRRGERFLVLHPSWGYFADAYGLEQVALEVDGREPKPAQLQRLIRLSRTLGIRVVFVQPQFSRRSAEVLARELSAEVVPIDPLAEDWDGNLREVARRFTTAVR